MIYMGKEILYAVAPLAISIPLYILGRKLFFSKYTQTEMHRLKSGRLFTLFIALLHIALMFVLIFLMDDSMKYLFL